MKRIKTNPTPNPTVIRMPSDGKESHELTSLMDSRANPFLRFTRRVHYCVIKNHLYLPIIALIIKSIFNRLSSDLPKMSIVEAVNKNKSDMLDNLLKSYLKGDVQKCIKKYLLLHQAVMKSSVNVLNSLLECCDDEEILSMKNSERMTALHVAVKQQNLDMFEALIRKSPSLLSIEDEFGNTPVHSIAKVGFTEACNKIVELNCTDHFNKINKNHEMPVHIAVLHNKRDVLRTLSSNGAKLTSKGPSNQTPLHYACDKGFSECVQVLVDAVEDETKRKEMVNARTRSNSTPLIMAAKNRFRACCELLDGADPDIKDNMGKTALHYAAQKGYLSIVRLLLEEKYANPGFRDKDGQTPLSSAASGPNEDVLDYLLQKSGDVDTNTAKKLLLITSKKNNFNCLKILLQKDTFVNLINDSPKGKSLLHLSLKMGNYKVSKLLLDKGADVAVMDLSSCEYPLHLAAAQNSAKTRFAEEERQQVCRMILSKSYNLVHEVNNKNETPLHLAGKSGNSDMINSLLKKGAKIMDLDNRNLTAVHLAAEFGREETLRRLFKDIFNSKIKEIQQIKPHPLHLAAQNGHLECCKIIVKELKMKNLTISDDEDMYPADLAYKTKQFACFRHLLSAMNFDSGCKEFCIRIHDYCEQSILEKRKPVFEAVIDSPWFMAAFDGFYCSNLHHPNPDHGVKPCQSFARLSKSYPEKTCELMDKYITKPANESYKEVHNYTPFEFIYYNEADDGTLLPHFKDSRPSPSNDNPKWFKSCHKLEETAKELEGVMWGRDHPLVEAAKRQDYLVLTHKLTKSWIENKFDSYIKWVIYFYLFMDVTTAILVIAMFSLMWNSNHLRDNFNMTYQFVCNAYNSAYHQSTIRYRIYNEVFERGSNCSEYCDLLKGGDGCNEYGTNENCYECSMCTGYFISTNTLAIIVLQVLVFLLFLFHLLIEIILIRIYKKRRTYMAAVSPVRYLRLICLLVILVPTSKCDAELGLRHTIQWQFGVVSVLVSCLCLVSTINKVPVLTIMMPFTRKFFQSYLKVVLIVGLLLISFSICFGFLLPHDEAFENIWVSQIKTLTWMLGDLGYNDTFIPENGRLDYPVLANVFFLVFILGIGSLAFNLVLRDSVDAIESIKAKSSFYQADGIIRLHLLIDDIFPSMRKKNTVWKRELVIPSNKASRASSVFYRSLSNEGRSMNEDNHSVCSLEGSADHKDELLSLVMKKLDSHQEEVSQLSKRFDKLLLKMGEMDSSFA